tara:strand:+ start:803 stop:967 length:165 start_codon:yes stop_codon:yes gene_type:complete
MANNDLESIAFEEEVEPCKDNNHDLTNEGYANADSGAEVLYCKKCGWSKEITYY